MAIIALSLLSSGSSVDNRIATIALSLLSRNSFFDIWMATIALSLLLSNSFVGFRIEITTLFESLAIHLLTSGWQA